MLGDACQGADQTGAEKASALPGASQDEDMSFRKLRDAKIDHLGALSKGPIRSRARFFLNAVQSARGQQMQQRKHLRTSQDLRLSKAHHGLMVGLVLFDKARK